MQKFIFDFDNTLVRCDFVESEYKYFSSILNSEDMKKFFPKLQKLLSSYEMLMNKYDIYTLSYFLTVKTDVLITPSEIKGWIDSLKSVNNIVEEEAVEVLEYLKCHNKNIVLLTNWFGESQKQRLINSGLVDYFDDIYSGDLYLKPNPKSFINACGDTSKEECIMIGDDYVKDYLGAKNTGINALHYTDVDDLENNKIKSLRKIIEKF